MIITTNDNKQFSSSSVQKIWALEQNRMSLTPIEEEDYLIAKDADFSNFSFRTRGKEYSFSNYIVQSCNEFFTDTEIRYQIDLAEPQLEEE